LRKALLALFIVLFIIIPACQRPHPQAELADTPTYRLQLVEEMKAFEKKLGFDETDNFKTYSEATEAYDYYFYTPRTTLPYSLDDPLLQHGTGKPESSLIDLEKNDVFFYSIESIAGVKTPITNSLLRAPLPRFIHIIFHEDWHEHMDSPLGIEEPCAEVVSYVAAMLFAEEKLGNDSVVYQTLEDEFNKKLEESKLYRQYYDELKALYSQFHSGAISEAETLSRKAELLAAMGNELEGIWGGKPDQLNNAFLAFQMTYFRHLPLMHDVFLNLNSNLAQTMTKFRAVPDQGAEFKNVVELKRIETEATDYLHDIIRVK